MRKSKSKSVPMYRPKRGTRKSIVQDMFVLYGRDAAIKCAALLRLAKGTAATWINDWEKGIESRP